MKQVMTIPSHAEILELLVIDNEFPPIRWNPTGSTSIPWKSAKEDLKIAIEYAVCFANRKRGVVIFGIEDKVSGRSKANHSSGNCGLDVWRRDIFDMASPPRTARYIYRSPGSPGNPS